MKSQKKKKKQKEYKKVVVVNDVDDYNLFLDNLEYFAKNQVPVAVNPNLILEQVKAGIAQLDYFATIEYNPESMTHRIIKVMPQMKDVYQALDDAKEGKGEEFDSTVDDVKEMLEYPEEEE